MQQIAKVLLTHNQYGLLTNSQTEDELRLVNAAIRLTEESGDEINRDYWEQLKYQSFKLSGNDIADAVSRIASAFRTPDVALSALRDAAEKTIGIAYEASHKQIAQAIQEEIARFNNKIPHATEPSEQERWSIIFWHLKPKYLT